METTSARRNEKMRVTVRIQPGQKHEALGNEELQKIPLTPPPKKMMRESRADGLLDGVGQYQKNNSPAEIAVDAAVVVLMGSSPAYDEPGSKVELGSEEPSTR